MKKLLFIISALALIAACATPYQRASRQTSNGYFDAKLQEGMYEVFFNGNQNTSFSKAHDFALLRASEICLENNYSSFEITRQMEDFTEKESETGITLFGGKISDIVKSEPKITLVVRCSKGNDLTYKAAELKTNLRTRYKLQ